MANMQFWGVDVKSKQPTQVALEEGQVIHLSQATLGEVKKDKETVTIHVKVGEQKLVLGMLSQTTPQLTFDLVFDEDFEISHNWKNGSVHLMGYQTAMEDDDDIFSDSSDDEEVPVLQKENGKLPEAAKPKVAAKPAKEVKPKPEEKDDSEDDSDDDEDDSDEDGDSDEDILGMSDDSEDDDEDDDDDNESEDEKPAKAESGKKRPNADAKTPESKKAKLATPQKTDGKKGSVHVATPHPSKKGGKTPGSDKSPKSGGQASCGPCKKSFNSDAALQSHNKAKHGGK
ncbi:unnamed protein product [Amaranthus hypochondriacus]